MALCYIAVANNGTRDNVYGVYPTWQKAFDRLKSIFADYTDRPDPTTLEALECEAQIIEIPTNGHELDFELPITEGDIFSGLEVYF